MGRGLAVFLAKFCEQRLLQQRLVTMTQRIPCLRHDTVLLQEGFQFRLLMIGVQLGLQNRGFYFTEGKNLLNLLLFEVGQTDGAHLALLVRLLHLTVARHIIACGLVDQQQVDVGGVQTGKCLVHCVGLLIEAGPQLGFQENLLPLQAGLLHSAANGLFVHIGVSCVDQAIAIPQGTDAGGLRLVRGQKKCADTGHGHFHAVIEICIFHKTTSFLKIICLRFCCRRTPLTSPCRSAPRR